QVDPRRHRHAEADDVVRRHHRRRGLGSGVRTGRRRPAGDVLRGGGSAEVGRQGKRHPQLSDPRHLCKMRLPMRPLLAITLLATLAPAAPVPKALKKADDKSGIVGIWKPDKGSEWFQFDAEGGM